MSVLYPTLLLCGYGFFSSLRPLEPFLTAYLLGPDKNLTETQVLNEIYPIWTYSYLVLLFPIFLATDYLRYKPVLVLQAISYVVTYVMLWKAQGKLAMQFLEFIFGLATASDVAYYSYIYSVVEPEHYQRLTGYCRSVTLFGAAAGGLIGQLLLSFAKTPLVHLVIITLASLCMASVAPWFLPMPKRSLFFHKRSGSEDNSGASPGKKSDEEKEIKVPLNTDGFSLMSVSTQPQSQCISLATVMQTLWRDFLQCYRCRPLLAWSLWWALATCGHFQIVNYTQVLWENIRPSSGYVIYNGYVETLSTLTGALAALLAGCLPVSWSVWGELLLCVLSLLMAACVFTMDLLHNIWSSYGCYVCFRATYMLLITVATFQIAANLSMQRFALVFGVNTFVALLLQSLLTLVVVDSVGLGLYIDIFAQFFIYGVYFSIIAVIFFLAWLFRVVSKRRCEKEALANGHAEISAECDSSPCTDVSQWRELALASIASHENQTCIDEKSSQLLQK